MKSQFKALALVALLIGSVMPAQAGFFGWFHSPAKVAIGSLFALVTVAYLSIFLKKQEAIRREAQFASQTRFAGENIQYAEYNSMHELYLQDALISEQLKKAREAEAIQAAARQEAARQAAETPQEHMNAHPLVAVAGAVSAATTEVSRVVQAIRNDTDTPWRRGPQ